jgi:hypothetical protein
MPLLFKTGSSRFIICNHDNNLREAVFLSVVGSDCGIANVNMELQVPKLEVLLEEKKNRWRT